MSNDCKVTEEKLNREYVKKLIYENISLTEKNYRLEVDMHRLNKKIEQLERANRRLVETALSGEIVEQIIIYKKKGFSGDN